MYSLRSINNMYAEFAGSRSDYVIVGHPEFNYGKVGSACGFGKGWDDQPIPCNPIKSPAVTNVIKKGGSTKMYARLGLVPDQPAPKPRERVLARATSAAAVSGKGGLEESDVRHSFDVFLAALKSPDSLPPHRADLMRTTQGCGNHATEGSGCRRGMAFREELEDVMAKLRRDPAGAQRDLLKTGAWKYYAFHLEMARRGEAHFQRRTRSSLPEITKQSRRTG